MTFTAGAEGGASTEPRLPETAFSIFHIKWNTTLSLDSAVRYKLSAGLDPVERVSPRPLARGKR